ncbi:hypothetical protein EPO66_05650 [bacterium]|nr:MAG: hypothetical protein EPO66_05650 [bacterium]
MPWQVGQYAVYQIVTMEGEGAGNRYKISIIGEETLNGEKFYWLQLDIYEEITVYGYNTVKKKSIKNISFKSLSKPKDTLSFIRDPFVFISEGIFPDSAVRLAVQVGQGQWYWMEPRSLSSFQGVIDNTDYSLTSHAKGRINFNRLKLDNNKPFINTPAGNFGCYHFYVPISKTDDYFDEGFDLYRTSLIPILGLAKLEFSKTLYWEKYSYRNESNLTPTLTDFIKGLCKKRIPGRRRPDTCTMLIIDYGPK